MKKKYFFMASFDPLRRNRTFILTIFLMLTLPITTVFLTSDQIILTKDEDSTKEFDQQIPKESYVYYQDTNGNAVDVYVSGNYAYVADGSEGLAIIDISDPTNPGSPVYENTSGNAVGVYVSGDYAYVADGSDGLAVIDISDPTNPGTPVYEDTTGSAKGVYISGDYAYVADDTSGLAIFNISNPTDPEIPFYEPITGEANSVYVSGDYAYVAYDWTGLAIINISDPTDPEVLAYEPTSGGANDVYVSGDYAYVADWGSGLVVIDISDPTDPVTTSNKHIFIDMKSVYVSGDYAYLGFSNGGLIIFDISDPYNIGTPIYENTTGWGEGVFVNGNYAYMADTTSGLAVIDISEQIDPETPIYEDTTGNSESVYVCGNYAYVADWTTGLAVFNISDPTNPGTPIYENTMGSAMDVYVSGNYAYVADGFTGGLGIIDISDPTNPGIPISGPVTDSARGVYVSGDYAYVADDGSGLAVFNISDPTNPGTAVYEPTTGDAYSVYVSGDYAYVAAGSSGLAVFNISNPTDPEIPVYEPTTGSARDVFISGDYAYVANYDNGLAVIDISDPTDPGIPVYEPTTGSAMDVYVSGDYAYVAVGSSGLAIIDISNPTNPGTPIYENTMGSAMGVYVSGDYAYVADQTSGLAVIKVRKRVDMVGPIISNAPSDLTVEYGYTGQNISWTVTDLNSGTYTIELQGSGIVKESTNWISGITITYIIQEGLAIGDYIYTVNFTDDYGNYIIDNVIITVINDLTDPIITEAPSDFSVDFGYAAQKIFWTASDTNPHSYKIELLGTGIVKESTNWISGKEISYFIPDGFAVGVYTYTITFTDDYLQTTTDSFNFTVKEISSGNIFENLSLIEKILYGSGILFVIGVVIAIPVVRNKKKRKQKDEVGIDKGSAEIKSDVKSKKSRQSEEKIQKKHGEVENELKSVSAQIQEENYTQAIASLKTLEKTVKKNKFLNDFKPEIDKKLKFCENTTNFRTDKEKFWKIYKSGENFMGAYDGISKLKADVDKFPSDSGLIHPAAVLQISEALQVLKGEYEERKAILLSGISSISDISKPEQILDLESKFINFEKEANALNMDYILPKINEQRTRYEKNIEIYKEKENLQLIFNQKDISKANFGITKLTETIEDVKRESGENYIYLAIALDISGLSKQVQEEINQRNASLFDLNKHYETMFTPDQIIDVKDLFGNILNDAEALGIKDLTQKIKHNLNICGVSIPFIEEKTKLLQIYSDGQLENAYIGLESLKNKIEVHPRQDLVAPNIKLDIENTYDDIYNEVKSKNAKIFGEIESIELLMKSEQISDAITRLTQLQDESSQLGFKEVGKKINRMIQVCNISMPILDDKNKFWSQYSDQNQLLPALDGLQNLVDDIDKGIQSDLILPLIVSDLREKIALLTNKLDEKRKEIEDKLNQITQSIEPKNLSEVIEVMKTQREIAQKLRFDDIDKKISEDLVDFEDVSKIFELFKRTKRLAIADILRKSGISREKLIDMMLDPKKGLEMVEMLEIDGEYIIAKQLLTQPKQGIAAIPTTEIKGTPYKTESEEISQNQELQIIREFEYLSGQVRFKVGVVNQSPGVLTNINIHFTIPDALKWITYEPIGYKRKGDSVIIPKLSLNEKKSLNLYLEPISCMSGPINAIVSYFNNLDEPRAITMRPKVIGITCPIFFTEEEANLARVESLYRQLSHKDKKLLPIHKDQDLHKIFNLLLKVGGSHQIKLVSKEFSAENKYGKILYYGLTKVKKQKMVISFLLRGGEQIIEVEIAGDNEEAITALLAEIENQLRVIFTDEKIIRSSDKFHEMKTSVILGYCPFCGADFDSAQQEEFIKGNSITCEYCDKVIKFN